MTHDPNLDVATLGGDRPKHVVVGSIHGNEVCGKEVIDSFCSEPPQLEKSLKLIIGNKRAVECDPRSKAYLDEDLNRVFGRDERERRQTYEQKLADKIINEIGDRKLLDLHSTVSYSKPFGVIQQLNVDTKWLAATTGLDRFVTIPQIQNSLIDVVNGVTAECGKTGTDNAIHNAQEIFENFLAGNGIINEPHDISNPVLYRAFERESVPEDAFKNNIEIYCENFSLVKEGDIYARVNGEHRIANTDFYPILMSATGYDHHNILGFKCKKQGQLLSQSEFQSLRSRLNGWFGEPASNCSVI